jgi:hypothetical protein
MIEFETVDGDRVWVHQGRVLLVTQAMVKEGGKPMPMLGCSMVNVAGLAPLFVKGNPADVVLKIEVGDAGSSRFSA